MDEKLVLDEEPVPTHNGECCIASLNYNSYIYPHLKIMCSHLLRDTHARYMYVLLTPKIDALQLTQDILNIGS